ncbi:cytochrome c oxidase, subunit VIa [Lipomyces japonicus]|uniref:cytochrome c oxidase, subunit VIa n=1 Tax=Lipomyces japonicus TaxID=56871 RepID=UPI0034CF8DEC
MSAIFRVARPVARSGAVPRVQARFNNVLYKPDHAKAKAFVEQASAIEHHAASTASFWLKVSLFVAIPLVTVSLVRSYKQESEHIHHLKHGHHEEPSDDLPPELPYQNIRNKDYFWGNGDKTLFWNDLANNHRT